MSALLALAAPLLAGLAVVRAIVGRAACPRSERVLRGATGVTIGAGLASLSHAALLYFGEGPGAALSGVKDAAFGAIAIASALWLVGRRRTDPEPLPASSGTVLPLPKALIVAAAIACVATVVVFARRTIHMPDGEFDAVAFWNLRGRLLLRGGGDAGVLFSPLMAASHPDYPLMLPGLSATGWLYAGDTVSGVPVVQALLWLALLVIALGAALARFRGSHASVLGILVLLAAPIVATTASQQVADVPLSALLLLSVVWLARAYESTPATARRCLVLCGVCASLAAWTKNEGLALCLVLALVVGAMPLRAVPRRGALLCLLAGATPLLLVTIAFKACLPPANDLLEGTTQAGLATHLLDPRRYLEIARAFLVEPFRMSRWSLMIPALLIASVLTRPREPSRPRRAVGAALVLVALAYAGVYVLTPQPLLWHLDSSLHRLLLHAYPGLVFWTLVWGPNLRAS